VIPESDIIAFYKLTNPYVVEHRVRAFIRKFRKIEAFIRKYDQTHV